MKKREMNQETDLRADSFKHKRREQKGLLIIIPGGMQYVGTMSFAAISKLSILPSVEGVGNRERAS